MPNARLQHRQTIAPAAFCTGGILQSDDLLRRVVRTPAETDVDAAVGNLREVSQRQTAALAKRMPQRRLHRRHLPSTDLLDVVQERRRNRRRLRVVEGWNLRQVRDARPAHRQWTAPARLAPRFCNAQDLLRRRQPQTPSKPTSTAAAVLRKCSQRQKVQHRHH